MEFKIILLHPLLRLIFIKSENIGIAQLLFLNLHMSIDVDLEKSLCGNMTIDGILYEY